MLSFEPYCQVVEFESDHLPSHLSKPFSVPLMEERLPWHMESNIQHNNTGMVSLESICLQRNNLQLNVFVQNVSFEKKVTMRYTTDQWKTFHEIDFEYQLSLFERDRFSLVFPLPRFQQRFHMEFSIRYQSNGLEFWDNNQEKNFCVELTRKSRTKEQPSGFQIQKGRQCQRSIFKDF